jgi:hypothetical protein
LGGFFMAVLGMVLGSIGPQSLKNHRGSHHRAVGLKP